MIAARAISKAYDGSPVLAGLDLSVATGETVALLGPSGVGKSTLLRIIAGLDPADAGAIFIDDVDVSQVPTHQRNLGFLFQDLALFPHFDVAGNVDFGLRMQKVSSETRRNRVHELLSLVGLADAGSRDPASLSGGERQRVALARALAPRPRALLLDEPFGALDRTLRDRLLTDLRGIFDDLGLTVIAVTHDPTEASALAGRVAVMLGGQIAQIGPAADLFATPRTRAVAAALGLRNVVAGRVSGGSVEVEGWGRFEFSAGTTSPSGTTGGVLVPRAAIGSLQATRSEEAHAIVDVVVDEVVLHDGQPVSVIRPAAGGATLEADFEGVRVGEHRQVSIDPSHVRTMD